MQLDHGALHALIGDVGEVRRFKRDLIGLGEGEVRAELGLIDGRGLKDAAKAGVDGKAGGESKRGRLGQTRLREVMEQAGVVLVDGGERALDVPKCCLLYTSRCV